MLSDRISTGDSPRGLEIVVTTKRNIFGLFIYGLLIIILACIEGFLIYFVMSMDGNARVAILIVLSAVTTYFVYCIYTWFWDYAGKERILITRDGFLVIKKDIFGFGYKYKYNLNKISGLRVVSQGWMISRHEEGGIIAFEHEDDTYHFGFDVDEIEAQVIINELYKHYVFKAG